MRITQVNELREEGSYYIVKNNLKGYKKLASIFVLEIDGDCILVSEDYGEPHRLCLEDLNIGTTNTYNKSYLFVKYGDALEYFRSI